MIEINLLPENQRQKKKGFEIDARYAVYIIPAILCLLLPVNLILGISGVYKGYRLGSLERQWKGLEPQKNSVETFRSEHAGFSADAKGMQQLVGQRVDIAEKLNRLSLDLPAGIWFSELLLTNKTFTLKGTVVSLKKDEMSLINKFLENLRNDSVFSKNFIGLELGSWERRTVGGYEVVHFILNSSIK